MHSRNKGARGELEACEALDAIGLDCRRTVQYNGQSGLADIVCDQAPNLHFEVKRTERLNLFGALDQALRDSKGKRLPVILCRSNHRPWMLCIRTVDVPAFIEEFQRARRIPTSDSQREAV